MTYVLTSTTTRRRRPTHTVDIAGTAWPVYKIEALVLGALVFVGAIALTTSMQVSVLAGAGAAVVAWWSSMLVEYRRSPSDR